MGRWTDQDILETDQSNKINVVFFLFKITTTQLLMVRE
jgi:hypothetical protein